MGNKIIIFLIVLAACFIHHPALYAIPTIKLTTSVDTYCIGKGSLFLEDPSSSMTLADVQKSKNWILSPTMIPNFGVTASSYWGRITLENTVGYPRNEWYFELGFPSIDYVDLYVTDSAGKTIEYHTGDRMPFHLRDVPSRNFVYRITLDKGKYSVFFRARTLGTMLLPVTVYSLKGFYSLNWEDIALGFYFGLMIAMFLYNLFLFLRLREASYFYYILYIFCFIWYQATESGFLSQFILTGSPDLVNASSHFSFIIAELFAVLFSIHFLSLKTTSRLLYRLFVALVAVHIVMALIINFIDYQMKMYISIPLAFLVILLILFAGIVTMLRGYRPAYFFSAAWASLIIMSMLGNAEQAGYIPSFFFIMWGIRIGSGMEVILLSMALAHRINLLKKSATEHELLYRDSQIRSQRLELELLKKTIQPHFLMNTMTAIRGWLIEKPQKAVDLLDALADEIRPIIQLSDRKEIPLSKEIEICNSHLAVMGLRHDRKYRLIQKNISGDETVPPLIFHTLVENAFTHQRPGRFSRFTLARETMIGGYRYIFTVDSAPFNSASSGEGTGSRYIRTRLEESYPGRWEMRQEAARGYWRTIIEIRDDKK